VKIYALDERAERLYEKKNSDHTWTTHGRPLISSFPLRPTCNESRYTCPT
jgi:hypothetical protein